MSVGADSLMGSVDMFKLLNKETLEQGRVIRKKDKMLVRMRCDLVAEGLKIPANNNDNFYDAEEVADMEFVHCVNELGEQDDDGAYYAMKTKDGELVHLYSIDLDFIQ